MDTSLSTADLARRAGVHLETLRYYERRGLLPRPPRGANGYRRYPAEAVRRLFFVKRAQAIGFSLDEVGDLLALRVRSGGRGCADVRRRAQRKAAEVGTKIRNLRTMKRVLDRLVASCADRSPTGACPVLDVLEKEERR